MRQRRQVAKTARQRSAARGQAALGPTTRAVIVQAPIDGVVTDLPLYAEKTAPSGAPVVTIMDVSRVIRAPMFPQTEAAELSVGNEANLIGPAGVPIPGKVTLNQRSARCRQQHG